MGAGRSVRGAPRGAQAEDDTGFRRRTKAIPPVLTKSQVSDSSLLLASHCQNPRAYSDQALPSPCPLSQLSFAQSLPFPVPHNLVLYER